MEFHENLHDLAVKEGLKGRKLHKAVESFTWNITILKVRFSSTTGEHTSDYSVGPTYNLSEFRLSPSDQ